ncbi:uncharacterized protein RCC_05748 [Ramularia collo-cygni]|uniref:Uncharacterized protein n=1 Tax=Ramularia collo-cygni TaxID=112498 RepID=A0A2D3URR6_9PEZI|nr:uncharacterized protein RCC_05748 [Ramularia collo-cygni]CZT19892.1 uncharacterized protein RCC_05748 [Ramularia collo-cygni]
MPSTLHFALLLAGTIASTKAQSDPYAYIDSVCSPSNASGFPDLAFPCNAVQAIQAQCIYGPSGLDIITGAEAEPTSTPQTQQHEESPPRAQNNATQQICFCKSQFWDLTTACASCYSAHGDHELEKSAGKDAVESMSRRYCDASAEPTLGLADFLFQFAGELDSSDDTSSNKTTEFKDPIGSKTDVSLYYTASVTGSQAWVVADPTATSGVVKDGQLVATASMNNEMAKKGDAGRKTGVVAAVLGLTGIAALLMV